MDSVTQMTFGAALGEAVLGPKVGRKALFWGAVLGTLPDLDVFIPLGGPVDDFVYHRGFSHSLFLLALLSPLLAWLITKIHPSTKMYFNRWLFLTFLVLETSVLLDFLTVYGTQVLWPFNPTPLAWPIFFIIDRFFTVPFLFGSMAALVPDQENVPGTSIKHGRPGSQHGLFGLGLWRQGVCGTKSQTQACAPKRSLQPAHLHTGPF